LADERLYHLIDHVCRVCGGRLLKSKPYRDDNDGRLIVRVRCADCGCHAQGEVGHTRTHELICVCGAKLPSGMKRGLKCWRNVRKSIEMPDEVVAITCDPVPRKPPASPEHRRKAAKPSLEPDFFGPEQEPSPS